MLNKIYLKGENRLEKQSSASFKLTLDIDHIHCSIRV
jgi:hypothetical protein